MPSSDMAAIAAALVAIFAVLGMAGTVVWILASVKKLREPLPHGMGLVTRMEFDELRASVGNCVTKVELAEFKTTIKESLADIKIYATESRHELANRLNDLNLVVSIMRKSLETVERDLEKIVDSNRVDK